MVTSYKNINWCHNKHRWDKRKGSYTNSELKNSTMKYIQANYLSGKWINIYTDESAIPGKGLECVLV
jgi:hypothetical protein